MDGTGGNRLGDAAQVGQVFDSMRAAPPAPLVVDVDSAMAAAPPGTLPAALVRRSVDISAGAPPGFPPPSYHQVQLEECEQRYRLGDAGALASPFAEYRGAAFCTLMEGVAFGLHHRDRYAAAVLHEAVIRMREMREALDRAGAP